MRCNWLYFLPVVCGAALPLAAAQGGGGHGAVRHGPPAFVLAKKADKGHGQGQGQGQAQVHAKPGGCDGANAGVEQTPKAQHAPKGPQGHQGKGGAPVKAAAGGCDGDRAHPGGGAKPAAGPTAAPTSAPQASCSGWRITRSDGTVVEAPAEPPVTHRPNHSVPPANAGVSSATPSVADQPSEGSAGPAVVHGNNGLGNGEDPQPKGNPKINDGAGSTVGEPGAKDGGGAPAHSGQGKPNGRGKP